MGHAAHTASCMIRSNRPTYFGPFCVDPRRNRLAGSAGCYVKGVPGALLFLSLSPPITEKGTSSFTPTLPSCPPRATLYQEKYVRRPKDGGVARRKRTGKNPTSGAQPGGNGGTAAGTRSRSRRFRRSTFWRVCRRSENVYPIEGYRRASEGVYRANPPSVPGGRCARVTPGGSSRGPRL